MSGPDDRTKGKCVVSKWVAWLTCILLIAAIVLAIVLPLTLGDDCDDVGVRIQYVPVPMEYTLVEPVDICEEEKPFDNFNVPASVQAMFAMMPDQQKYSQAQQWSYGDASGLPLLEEGMTLDSMIEMAQNKETGSYINVVTRDWVQQIQDAAMESDPKIPVLFGYDVIHGHKTMQPVNIGCAATFSRDLIYEGARIAAIEAAAEGITWTFAPMLDISRDPRWGRISESFGEDVYLAGELGVAFTKGFQDNGVAACVKHVAAYGAAQAGRDYSTAQLGKAYLFNDYLPAYRKSFDAGALTAMASFNTIEGVPSHANRELLTDVLRGMWGWDGMIVADYGGIRELIPHGVVGEGDGSAAQMYSPAAKAGILAGVDMSMADSYYHNGLDLIKNDMDEFNRTVSEYVDLSNKRILAVKHALNLFEKPMGPFTDAEAEAIIPCNPEYLAVAQETAEAAMVLLKNNANTLPIPLTDATPAEKKKIMVMGRTAKSKPDMLGFWNAQGMECCAQIIPFFQGIETKYNGDEYEVSELIGSIDKVFYGEVDDTDHVCPRDDRQRLYPNAQEVQESDADYIIFVAGEGYTEHGEAGSKSNLDLPDLELLKIVAENRPEKTKLILVIIGGRQFTVEWEEITELEYENEAGQTVTRQAVDAIIQAWSPGTMGGPALANLLSGDVDFSGRMPVTTPRNVGQVPIYYSQLSGGRPSGERADQMWQEEDNKWFVQSYLDVRATPLYTFGYGLSYATYTYSGVSLTGGAQTVTVGEHDKVTVTVSVASNVNTPTYNVVQVYVKQLIGGYYISPPQKLLKGFERVLVPATGSVTQTFELDVWEDFGYYNNDLLYSVVPGEYKIFVGQDADDESHALTVHVTAENTRASA